MPSILLPSRMTQQPQQAAVIDWSNPLALGLRSAVLPGLNRGYDVVAGRLPATTGTRPTAIGSGMSAGFGSAVGAGSTDRIVTGLTSVLTASGRSYYFRARRNGAGGGAFGRLFDKGNGSAGQYLMWYDSQSKLSYSFYRPNETNINFGSFIPVGATFEVLVTHFYDGSNHVINAYVDGVQVLANSLAPGTNADTSAVAYTIGNRTSDNARSWDGLIECAYMWDRVLTLSDAAALAQNRYQIFKAPARRLWIAGSSEAPGPISGTFAASEAEDLLAASGSATFTAITGAASSAETSDTLAASGGAAFGAITGTAGSTELSDSMAAAGSASFTGISGASAVTEPADTATGSGTPTFPALSGAVASLESGDALSGTGAVFSAISGSMAATEAPDTLAAGIVQMDTSLGGGGGGGGGSVREVRAFADLLDKARKPSRSQKKARRRQLEVQALELLPDLPEAEKIAPVVARIVYEQEAKAMAPLYAARPIQALEPVAIPFDAHEALRELIDKLLAEAALQQKVAEDEENDIELLLFGT